MNILLECFYVEHGLGNRFRQRNHHEAFHFSIGSAKTNMVVLVALYPIVKESFQLYYDITEIMENLIGRFTDLEVADAVKGYEIFCRVAKQFDELDMFYDWCKNGGIARASEYPEVEKIPNKKLEVMDEFVREKSASAKNKVKYLEAAQVAVEEEKNPETETEEDMNAIKALPPPEGIPEGNEEEKKEEAEETIEKDDKAQQEADFLNIGADAPTTEEHANKLALALFDGAPAPTTGSTTPAWEAFNESGDWETALVQSASCLSNQTASLPGGFDMLLLDGMYQKGATSAAMASSGYIATGSASSVALGSAGKPAMLALPAPPVADGGAATPTTSADPFAASLAVAPPPYVQMSEMEKKQGLLVEEQLMWQQYARDGMQGQLGVAKVQQNPYPYNTGSYTHGY